MITIFSIDSDQSTNHVIDWLDYLKVDWQRINVEYFDNNELTINLSNSPTKNNNQNVVWFRKWNSAADKITYNTDNPYIHINKEKEHDEYSKHLFYLYKNSFWLNNPDNWKIDKLTQLNEAIKVGLTIPPTIFTNSKQKVFEFKARYSDIITKNLAANLFEILDNDAYLSYTQKVSDEDINSLNESFYPSLIQKEIKKDFEIRTFYIDGDFYSMAIFSQNDNETRIDFRQYNLKKPNRTVSFILPSNIEHKTKKLMNKLDINSGSIDFIKDIEGNYIFLEINPLGQFGMTSSPCNYNLERKVAEYLIKKQNE